MPAFRAYVHFLMEQSMLKSFQLVVVPWYRWTADAEITKEFMPTMHPKDNIVH
jgi:hypothetical protein